MTTAAMIAVAAGMADAHSEVGVEVAVEAAPSAVAEAAVRAVPAAAPVAQGEGPVDSEDPVVPAPALLGRWVSRAFRVALPI